MRADGYVPTPAQRARYNAAQLLKERAQRAARAQAGLCRHCGRTPVPDGAYGCAACREQKRWSELRRFVAGRCRRCGKPRGETTKVNCAACRVVARVRAREYRARTGWRPTIRVVSDAYWHRLTGEGRGKVTTQ